MNLNNAKLSFITISGFVGGVLTTTLGEMNIVIKTLLIFMAIDYITGVMVAAVFKQSKKTENGALESNIGFKGICKKGTMLLVVMLAYRIDLMNGSNFIRNGVTIAFIANEGISILENAGLMGVPIPEVLKGAIEVLNVKKAG